MIDIIDYRDRGPRYKVAELEGELLDKAVYKALLPMAMRAFSREHWDPEYVPPPELPYSTDWAAGGPLIERERIMLEPPWSPNAGGAGVWVAWREFDRDGGRGDSPLIAAMRAFVTDKLGDEIHL